MATAVLPTVILHARLSPSPSTPALSLACLVSSPPLLVDLNTKEVFPLPLTSSRVTETGSSVSGRNRSGESVGIASPAAAAFSKLGNLVYVGTARGEILVISVESRAVIFSLQGPGGSWIKQLHLSRNGQFLLTNSNDRVIRVYENLVDSHKLYRQQHKAGGPKGSASTAGSAAALDRPLEHRACEVPMLRFLKEYQDAVNRCQWKAACFSGNGEYVAGAPLIRGEHKIHIFSRGFGQLARILEGPKEGVVDLAWHPTRPTVASVSQSGLVYLWAKDYMENWSAFAPDFKELEDNEEYVEREDEFDIVADEDKVKPTKQADENADVDIETVEKITAFSDSDDSENGLYFLPTAPEPDERPDLVDAEEGPEVDGPHTVHLVEARVQEGEEEGTPPPQIQSERQRDTETGRDTGRDRQRECERDRERERERPTEMEREGKRAGSITGESGPDEEARQSGRQARRRKLSEKAAELESAKKAAKGSSGPKRNGQP